MTTFKLGIVVVSAMALAMATSLSSAATTGNATPSVYKITLQQVQFHKVGTPTDEYVTFASGSGTFDIAGVLPNRPCGVLAQTGPLAPGTYDKMRFTVSKTMILKGTSSGNLSNGKPCRTASASTSVSNPFGDGSVNTAYSGSVDGGTPQEEVTQVPTGSAVVLPSGFVDLGTSLQGTLDVNFTMVAGQTIPNVKVVFDVTNAIQFQPLESNPNACVVFPGPPSISIVNT